MQPSIAVVSLSLSPALTHSMYVRVYIHVCISVELYVVYIYIYIFRRRVSRTLRRVCNKLPSLWTWKHLGIWFPMEKNISFAQVAIAFLLPRFYVCVVCVFHRFRLSFFVVLYVSLSWRQCVHSIYAIECRTWHLLPFMELNARRSIQNVCV